MDTEEMERLVYDYSPLLLRAAFLYLKNSADAEDAVQDVFLRYLQRRPHFANEAARKAWLYKTTLNCCRDRLRSAWHRKRAALTEDLAYLPPEQSTLVEAMLRLDTKYRIPLHLHYYEGYSIRELSAMLALPAATVGSRLHRGREQLKRLLGGDSDETL